MRTPPRGFEKGEGVWEASATSSERIVFVVMHSQKEDRESTNRSGTYKGGGGLLRMLARSTLKRGSNSAVSRRRKRGGRGLLSTLTPERGGGESTCSGQLRLHGL